MRREQMHEAPAPKTPRPAEHTIEHHGNDGRIQVFHDALEAAPERQQLPDARDLSLGKNAHDLAVADGVAGGLQRVNQFARTLFGRDGNHPQHFGERLHPRLFVNVLEHQKPHGAVGRGQQ